MNNMFKVFKKKTTQEKLQFLIFNFMYEIFKLDDVKNFVERDITNHKTKETWKLSLHKVKE